MVLLSLSVLLSPVLSDISWPAVVAMMISGLGWEHIVYMVQSSERGRGATQSTAGSHIKCSLFVPIKLLFTLSMIFTWYSAGLAIICGAMTSGLGYVMCYQSLIWLKADTAATLQLTVPIITLFLGFILLSESISLTQAVCSSNFSLGRCEFKTKSNLIAMFRVKIYCVCNVHAGLIN
ncbi:EamA family transporter [Pseudoalteromonas aurantia]|uniref:EamA family transporter n=2 Tax=Pseudoalteromonas aurantia TaxID=43654 RepID=UPI0014860626|nr:EamA family transporter [Pseudoalteromonas aurantia]